MSHPSLLGEPDAGPTDPATLPRPDRPTLIELSAALLIVGAIIGLVGVVAALETLPQGTAAFVALTAGLEIGAVIVGVLIRSGRAWLLAINVVAVLGFLDLLAAATSGLALIRGVVDLGIVVVLVQHKPWFEAMAAWRRRLVGGPPRDAGSGDAERRLSP